MRGMVGKRNVIPLDQAGRPVQFDAAEERTDMDKMCGIPETSV